MRLHGGKLNTDFVDNSGGVDCSDHEVNIKILLNNLPTRAGLTLAKRNKLLVDMTDEVAHLVLRDNYLQSQALSMLETRAVSDLLEHAHSIRSLELPGALDRALEFLPRAEEIAERHKVGRGLTRPELADPARLLQDGAVLAAHRFRRARGSVPGARAGALLPAAHPAALRQVSAPASPAPRDHRDGDDQQHGESHGPDVRAARAGRHRRRTPRRSCAPTRSRAKSFDMRTTWRQIEALDTKIEASMQYEMMYETTRLLRFCTYWLIHHQSGKLDIERRCRACDAGLTDLDAALPAC